MKAVKYILGFIVGLFGAGIAFSGLLGIFDNLVGQVNLADLIGDILTEVIGLYLLIKIGLRLFRQEKFKFW